MVREGVSIKTQQAGGGREDIYREVAEKIRAASKNDGRLIPSEAMAEILPASESPQDDRAPSPIDTYLDEIRGREEYQDIKTVVASNGLLYLYSEAHMTRSYAHLMSRIEVGDMLATMAATVREESRIYPRPTNVKLFLESPFSLPQEDLEGHVSRLLTGNEYRDIASLEASTGARYLYSKLHLDEVMAKRLAEEEELGFENQ